MNGANSCRPNLPHNVDDTELAITPDLLQQEIHRAEQTASVGRVPVTKNIMYNTLNKVKAHAGANNSFGKGGCLPMQKIRRSGHADFGDFVIKMYLHVSAITV